jgi:hypothetical protein
MNIEKKEKEGEVNKKGTRKLGMVVCTCSPSYLGA